MNVDKLRNQLGNGNDNAAKIEEQEEGEEEGSSKWGDLPTVVLVEIYRNLNSSRRDRLNASSVCKNWRLPAFQVPLGEGLTLDLQNHNYVPRVDFLTEQFGCKVKDVKIRVDVRTKWTADCVERVLKILRNNQQLRALKVECSENCLAYLQKFGEQDGVFERKVVTPLLLLLEGLSKGLTSFSFPLIEGLSIPDGQRIILKLLEGKSLFTLTSLHLPSLKGHISDNEIPRGIPGFMGMSKFHRLEVLSIGHEELTDNLLSILGSESTVGGLKRLNIVAVMSNRSVSRDGWNCFVLNNPQCQVRLTISGGSDLLSTGSNLVFPNIPLTHLRAFYSKEMRIRFLCSLIGWNIETLEHLELVDDNRDWMMEAREVGEDEQMLDPIVYAAWRCKNLHTIKLGLRYCGDSLVGVARLMGERLKVLEIPKCSVIVNSLNLRKLSKEISSALSRPWRPLEGSKHPRKSRNHHHQRNRNRKPGLSKLMTETLRAIKIDGEKSDDKPHPTPPPPNHQ